MRARAVVVAALAALVTASPAQATLRVESTLEAGLVLTDKQGNCSDDVEIARVPEGSTTEWAINTAGSCLGGVNDVIQFEIGPGCRELGIVFDISARCSRFSAKVTANLLGGNDTFAVAANSQPVAGGLTINLGAGNDSGTGSPGPDALNGGSGNDQLRGEAGNDTLAGNDGNDGIRPGVGADTADGGAGDDDVRLSTPARDETDTVNGGPGTDTAQYADEPSGPGGDRLTSLRIIEANLETLAGEKDTNENDVLRSIERYGGGASSDIITGALSSNPSLYNGGLSADQLFGTSGPNTLVGSDGSDELVGNGGNDTLNGKQGEFGTAQPDPVIDCGPGSGDQAILDLTDDATPTSCENVDRSPINEGPHVQPVIRETTAVRRGRVAVRLRCPAALSRRCAGTLELRRAGERSPRTRYAISPGRSRLVRVRLGSLTAGRGTVAQLVSLERGIDGRKTTLRRIVLGR